LPCIYWICILLLSLVLSIHNTNRKENDYWHSVQMLQSRAANGRDSTTKRRQTVCQDLWRRVPNCS
jgi:hypothetical protein